MFWSTSRKSVVALNQTRNKHMSRIIGIDGKPVGGGDQPLMMAGVGIGGLRAEYHELRYNDKIVKCPGDCGIDLFPCDIKKVEQKGPLAVYLVSTGVHILLPSGAYGRIVSRSSTIDKLNGGWVIDGTIDAGYTGEYFIRVAAHGKVDMTTVPWTGPIDDEIRICIAKGQALAQVIIAPFFVPHLQTVNVARIGSPRGDAGFGSTAVKEVVQ